MNEVISSPERLAEFLFETSLYEKWVVVKSKSNADLLTGRSKKTIDGYCTVCKREVPWRVPGFDVSEVLYDYFHKEERHDQFAIVCNRCDQETIFHLFYSPPEIWKVGQLTSLAKIAFSEISHLRTQLSEQDNEELGRALGLFAHGVGIGSFVYLRRIFERLIQERFEEFQESEHWDEAEFMALRMEEKIKFLESHLPQFLVEHRKVYGSLSMGLHTMSEDWCLAGFPVMKEAIITILEDDKRKREELRQRAELEKAIKAFANPDKSKET